MSRRVFALLAVILLPLMLAACSPGGSSEQPTSPSQAGSIPGDAAIQTVTVPTRWASAIASDLPTLTANSDAVFVGRVVRLKGQRQEPLVSGIDEPSAAVDGKPSRQPGTFPISTYEVRVDRSVIGAHSAPSTVFVEQAGGTSVRADGTLMRVVLEDDQPLEPGQQYLFFARTKENGTLSVAPFARLVLTDHGLQPLVRWEDLGALAMLSGKPLDQAAALVQAVGGR